MKLTKVRVKDFKSIRDSNSFEIGNVTCLVGKNEAGKTAILEALYRLNPIIPEHAKFDVTEDYPRADVEEYQVAIDEKNAHTWRR
jgi:AAA15 family ATPase/GTPase